MKKSALILCMLCVATTCGNMASASSFVSKKDAQDYVTCTELIRSNPAQALTKATLWVKNDRVPAAYHCKAMSEFALKRYSAAASTLAKMHALLPMNEFRIRANVELQQVKAWRLSGELNKALAIANNAILTIRTDKTAHDEALSAILVERSKVFSTKREPLRAMQDLDHAITLNASATQALLQRAKLYQSMGEKALALKDVRSVLQNAPNTPKAKELLSALEQ